MKNKRGAAMATNTIILLVLGLAILVMLIFGFTMGFNKILPFLSSKNVDQIVTACNTACITNSIYGFCSEERTLVDEKEKQFVQTCEVFSTNGTFARFGIKSCSSITCPKVVVPAAE